MLTNLLGILASILIPASSVASNIDGQIDEQIGSFFEPLKKSYKPEAAASAMSVVGNQSDDSDVKGDLQAHLSEHGAVSSYKKELIEYAAEGRIIRVHYTIKHHGNHQYTGIFQFYKDHNGDVRLMDVSLDD